MNKFEKLKKYYLLFALDEPFFLSHLIFDIEIEFDIKDKKKLNNKILEIVEYFIKSDLFEIGTYFAGDCFKKNDLSLAENINKINSILNKLTKGDDLWNILIGLTENGNKEAKKYLLKKIHLKERILICGKEKEQSLEAILKTTKNEFKTIDWEEISYETNDALSSLFQDFIEIGYLKDNRLFIGVLCNSDEMETKVKTDLIKIHSLSVTDDLAWFRNTPATNALIEKWQECGGRLVNKWYYYIDNK